MGHERCSGNILGSYLVREARNTGGNGDYHSDGFEVFVRYVISLGCMLRCTIFNQLRQVVHSILNWASNERMRMWNGETGREGDNEFQDPGLDPN